MKPDPRRRYWYSEHGWDRMAGCSFIELEGSYATPDDLIFFAAERIAVLGDGIPRLKRLIASLEVLRDEVERTRVAQVTMRFKE